MEGHIGINVPNWQSLTGIFMEFGVDLDQTAVGTGHEMAGDLHEIPCHIF